MTLLSILHSEPYIRAVVRDSAETVESGMEIDAMAANIRGLFKKAVELSPNLNEEQLAVVLNTEDLAAMADLVASNLDLPMEKAQEILEIVDPIERLKALSEVLGREVQVLTMQAKIQSQAKDEMSKTQREEGWRARLFQMDELTAAAKACRVWRVMRPYMEALGA